MKCGLIKTGLILLSLLNCVGVVKAQKKTNIIYILADDMGYGDLGCYGQKIIRTPNIDNLAASGMLFTNHYAGAPVCAPSRAVLMTGRDIGHARVRGNYESGPNGFGAGLELRKEDTTIAEVLKLRGYTTALIGKWGMGVQGTTGEPNKKGFDYSYGFLNQGHAHYQFPDYLFKNGKRIEIPENKNDARKSYTNDLFTKEAVSFLSKNKEKPFFLYLAYTTPHAELLVPNDTIFNSYKGKFEETPFVKNKQGSSANSDDFGAYGSQDYPNAAYAACITHLDACIGKLIAYLKASGLYDNTIIIFSSDNGPAKEGGANPDYFKSSGILRGKKRDVYEGGIRVPLIVSWHKHIKSGTISSHISAFQDVMSTLVDVAKQPLDSNFKTEGLSFYPTLLGETDKQKKHPYLYWEFHENKTTSQAILMDNWKAVRMAPDASLELYNLANDPSETKDVAAQNLDIIKKIESLLQTCRTDNKYWPLKYKLLKKVNDKK